MKGETEKTWTVQLRKVGDKVGTRAKVDKNHKCSEESVVFAPSCNENLGAPDEINRQQV